MVTSHWPCAVIFGLRLIKKARLENGLTVAMSRGARNRDGADGSIAVLAGFVQDDKKRQFKLSRG